MESIMERYSLKKANLGFQQNPRNISMIQEFQEKFQMEFCFCWVTVCPYGADLRLDIK